MLFSSLFFFQLKRKKKEEEKKDPENLSGKAVSECVVLSVQAQATAVTSDGREEGAAGEACKGRAAAPSTEPPPARSLCARC